MAVETGGYRNPDTVTGDKGKAIGALQIHRGVVEDVNRLSGTHYSWAGMTNRADARRVCELYLKHYAKGKSPEEAARIWNGGPNANTKSRRHLTDAYWAKVNRHLSPELAKN